MKKSKAIGIIGGMGPEASQYFYGLLIKKAQRDYGVKSNNEFPEVYIASIPVPDFIEDQKKVNEALETLCNRMKLMELLPIAFYCLACNTGHILIDELRTKTQKPFMSLLEEVPKFLKERNVGKVGLMATPMTIEMGLYQGPLKRVGIEMFVPGKTDQVRLGKIIKETIAGVNKEKNSVEVQKIAKGLLSKGAEAILETCTEIPLIFPVQHLVPVYDSLEILAEAVLKRYYKKEEK